MPEVRPFAGLRYRVPDSELARVLAPPYDVIGPEYQRELYERDPRNVVRAILNRTEGDGGYREAGATFRRWRQAGVLAEDPAPAVYLLEQDFEAEGRRLVRRGVLARVRAEDPETGSILPHEQTRKGPREDRWRVLLATRANFSPVFLMFPDPRGRFAAETAPVMRERPLVAYEDDAGVGHRLWRVTEPHTVEALRDLLGGTRAYIADGHHRYATALRYAQENGPEGAWTFGYFTPLEDPGLVVLPYHRVLAEGPSLSQARELLGAAFDVRGVSGASEAARSAALSKRRYAFGLVEPGGAGFLAEARPEAEGWLAEAAPPSLRALDAFFLHEAVLPRLGVPGEGVRYVHSLNEAEEELARRRCRLAVLLRPTPVGQVVAVADARLSMPAKSTFFHPKLPSGLVIHPLAV